MSIGVSATPPASWCLSEALSGMPLTSLVGGPVPNSSRQGRHRQRYGEGGERLVAGCIPVRNAKPGCSADGVQVLLITSRGGKGWVFPKGGWEDDETVDAAAMRETVEEAGVRGSLEEPILGTFWFQSMKQERLHNVHQGRCVAHIFVMHVQEELELWPECKDRNRYWVPLRDALPLCRHQWMRDALTTWIVRRGWSRVLEWNPLENASSQVTQNGGCMAARR